MNSYALIDLHCDTLADWKYANTGNPDTLDDPGRVLQLSNMPADAAGIVLDLKTDYPKITPESTIPCETQAITWTFITIAGVMTALKNEILFRIM